MLCYYSLLHTNDYFNKDILIQMYLHWIENSRNKMSNLHYNGKDDFYYAIPHKEPMSLSLFLRNYMLMTLRV